jgi:threonine/homoserine/homoserine lactone efflux protein
MELTPFTFLAAFAGIQLLAAISPGPAFAVVTQRALQGGRAAGLAAAGGCTLGLFFWLSATMVGLAFLISTFWWLYAALRVLGGLFLIYLAFQLWRHAHTPFASSPPAPIPDKGALNHFRAGLFVQLSNPKALAYCASVLVTLLPPVQPLWMKIAIPLVGSTVEGSWWIFVAMVFSTGTFRKRYAAVKVYLDRAMGAALGVLGVKLLLERP